MSSPTEYEWFEILELKTKKQVYVNSLTGKSQWQKPEKYQQLMANQWWELFDFKSNHHYYYNSQTSSKTWVKPNVANVVSLVRLQVLKEQKKKTFIDQITQTSFENLNDIDSDHEVITDLYGYEENIETSGYDRCWGDNETIDHLIKLAKGDDDKEFNYTLPSIIRPAPRTNGMSNLHSKYLRLSQPIIEICGDTGAEDFEYSVITDNESLTNYSLGSLGHTSATSVDQSYDCNLQRMHSAPADKCDHRNFPRDSVINAIGPTVSLNQEIWSRNLFSKSGSRLAGIKTWTSKSIQDSLLATTPKAYKKKACENFKQIQMYMGDRPSHHSKEVLALTICRRGISSMAWVNEIFMQLCKQVTYNPDRESTFNGWELICICLMFFHPESLEMKNSFKSFLNQYACLDLKLDQDMLKGQDFYSKSIFCARISRKLLEMSHRAQEVTADNVFEAKQSYASSTIFYSSLNEVMDIQRLRYPIRKLPWIQVALTREIIRCGGAQTQGILRIPSEISKIEVLSNAIEKAFKQQSVIDLPVQNDDDCDPLLNKILDDLQFEHDPLLLSSVLKLWLRNFRDPLLSFSDDEDSLAVISKDYSKIEQKIETIPALNYLVLKYLIYFLQVLARPENVTYTNMPVENLVTLMAPTLFRLDFIQLQPAMQLLQNLIMNLDTSDVENMT